MSTKTTKKPSTVKVIGATKRKGGLNPWENTVNSMIWEHADYIQTLTVDQAELARRIETLEAAQLDMQTTADWLAEQCKFLGSCEECGDGFSGGRALRPGLWARAWNYLRPGK